MDEGDADDDESDFPLVIPAGKSVAETSTDCTVVDLPAASDRPTDEAAKAPAGAIIDSALLAFSDKMLIFSKAPRAAG